LQKNNINVKIFTAYYIYPAQHNAQNRAQADRHHQDTMADNEKQRAHEKELHFTSSEQAGEVSGETE